MEDPAQVPVRSVEQDARPQGTEHLRQPRSGKGAGIRRRIRPAGASRQFVEFEVDHLDCRPACPATPGGDRGSAAAVLELWVAAPQWWTVLETITLDRLMWPSARRQFAL